MKVIVADDDVLFQRLLEETLRPWGYATQIASNGEDAWELITNCSEPCIALLDWVMRRKDLMKYRRAAVAAARGRVLEIGVGSGLNFALYGKQVELVFHPVIDAQAVSIERSRIRKGGIELSDGGCGIVSPVGQ